MTPGGAVVSKPMKNQDALVKQMLSALRKVDPLARSLMDELGNRKAANWGLINDGLVEVSRAIAAAEKAAKS